MVNILLVCTAGMSTSMLVAKMQVAAKDKALEANIWSVGDADSKDAIKKADIILLGPQVRYLKDTIIKRVNNEKPVMVVDMRIYGTMDGNLALESAMKELENFKKEENN